ncbi:GNAT family N-acetyltransferase [Arthrobacter sunyaminii]|uniref:GNAT family N-acetyltransferase n=1 Tax=Arthrobacter sunyaminii TaxID=2816859 RepID=A0A975PG38_9MICC|nr:GNAT family protein [Arthrobacter sunyaminii]MBO0909501.1 GNAT family N-acetyltransferase [Arthrobacter sunyaminii]QWQ36187.1 GNAT family N-acetyltransferase [Arthrobacter sunyaminii]
MTAVRPASSVLTGRFVRLEPLTTGLLPELHRAIAVPEVFAGGYGGGPAGLHPEPDAFAAWAQTYYRWDALPFAVRLLQDGRPGPVAGTSTLADLDLRQETIQLGWTAYSPSVWGTAVNAETKLLLLEHAFGAGFGRVSLQADSRNARSRAAIEKLGGTFEGILRRDRLRADGSWRDTAVYSILAPEWPAVRVALEDRLSRFSGVANAGPTVQGQRQR